MKKDYKGWTLLLLMLAISPALLGEESGNLRADDPQTRGSNRPGRKGENVVPILAWKLDGETVPELSAKRSDKVVYFLPQRDEDKTPASKMQELKPFDIKYMDGEGQYVADLVLQDRKTFINFFLQATPGDSADEGTIINIQGAILGYAYGGSGKEAGTKAQLMVKQLDENAETKWMPINFFMGVNLETNLTNAAKLGVRFEPNDDTWALYSSDRLLKSGLKRLVDRDSIPTVAIRPGILAGDRAMLFELQVTGRPYSRSGRFLPTGPGGILDLKKALESNDPRLIRAQGAANLGELMRGPELGKKQ